MSYWAFQADPARYRVLPALLDAPETTWLVKRYSDQIKVGDTVLLWQSGEHAGGYAMAEVIEPVKEQADDGASSSFWTNPGEETEPSPRTRLRMTDRHYLYPVLRKVALEDPVLSEMLIVRQPAGTNFPVTDKQFRRIEMLLARRPERWSREESICALALYHDIKDGRAAAEAAKYHLCRLLQRTDFAIDARVDGFRRIDVDPTSNQPNEVTAQQRDVWTEFAGRPDDARSAASEIERKLLEGGGLQRITSPSSPMERVRTSGQIRDCLRTFNGEAPRNSERARALIQQTTYWVFDPESRTFCPSKFAGYVGMDFLRYADGSALDGGEARTAVERASGQKYAERGNLRTRLVAWGSSLLGDGVFAALQTNVDETKWRFVELGLDTTFARPRRYWKIAPGEDAHLWPDQRDEGIIAIGWGEVGDARSFKSKDELAAKMLTTFDGYTEGKARTNADQVWTFATEIGVGDIIVANKGKSRVVGRGEVLSGYEHRPERKGYQHCFRVRWFDTDGRDIPEQGAWFRTILDIPADRYAQLFGEETMNAKVSIYDFLRDRGLHFPSEVVTTYLLSLKTKPFVILSGISGTGKTKLAQAIAEWAGTEKREVEEEEPARSADEEWLYQLKPYNLPRRFAYIPRERESLFDLPLEGTVALPLFFDGVRFEGKLGAVKSEGRTLWQIRFGGAAGKMEEHLKEGDFIKIHVEVQDEQQVLRIDRVTKQRRTRIETIKRYEFVSVRSDWLDGKEVLGFFNVLTEEYVTRPFLSLMLRAHREKEHPYFVILDEMNLARVEHYFADLLSATESRTRNGDTLNQEPLHLHDMPQCSPLAPPEEWVRPAGCASCNASDAEVERCALHFDGVQLVPPRLRVPANVHVTGTVNIDETTHMFSPKVLDRANVIEFNRVDLANYGGDKEKSDYVLKAGTLTLGGAMVATQADFHAAPKATQEVLVALNDLLAEYNLHFGYRVANEVALYVRTATEEIGKKAEDAALDLQILQKVLPKLHGPKQKLAEPLRRLLLFTALGANIKTATEAEHVAVEQALASGDPVPSSGGGEPIAAKMPRSGRKLARMLRTLRAQGFVSFIE